MFNLFPSSVQTDVTLQTCSVLTILQRTNHWNNIVQQTFSIFFWSEPKVRLVTKIFLWYSCKVYHLLSILTPFDYWYIFKTDLFVKEYIFILWKSLLIMGRSLSYLPNLYSLTVNFWLNVIFPVQFWIYKFV